MPTGPSVCAAGTAAKDAGALLRGVRRAVALLPRGRARIARALSRCLSRPFVDLVEPAELGLRMIVNPSDPFQVAIWVGAYQPHVIAFLRASIRPGDNVLCAGLHVGYIAGLARILAGPRGRVFSAEPDPAARAQAELNLNISHSPRVAPIDILPAGLSSANGDIALHQSSVLGHSSFAVDHQPAGVVAAKTLRGDDWLESLGVNRLDVLILDVEGWEAQALDGLSGTIARSPGLRAMVELSGWALEGAGSSKGSVVRFWQERGFIVRLALQYPAAPWGASGPELLDPDSSPDGDAICYRPRETADNSC